jgi:hypothetical protein
MWEIAGMMGLLFNKRKLTAAASSMHQFCQETRALFPGGGADNAVVEAATMFLYLRTAEPMFGRRFAGALAEQLKARLKYTSPGDMKATLHRIHSRATQFERARVAKLDSRDAEEMVRAHVTSVIESLLAEAGETAGEPEVIRDAYARLENLVRDMKRHLAGIKEQNVFLMKRAG